jgi:Leucine-rich repeat (LRR) protein
MPLFKSVLAIAVLLLSLASLARPCAEQEKSALLRLIAGLSQDGGLDVS